MLLDFSTSYMAPTPYPPNSTLVVNDGLQLRKVRVGAVWS